MVCPRVKGGKGGNHQEYVKHASTGKENALASVISKLVEVIMLDRIEMYMITNPNQFGFKRKHGTDQCIYVIKEIIDLYRKLNGSVFVCFLDASKAFDRVNHTTLFKQLGARGIPGYILRILSYWYKNQDMCIRWGDAYSAKFKVTNGVRPLTFSM